MTGEENYNKKKVLKAFLWLKLKELGLLVSGGTLFIINCYVGHFLFNLLLSPPGSSNWFDFFASGITLSCLEFCIGLLGYYLIKANWKKAKKIVRNKEMEVTKNEEEEQEEDL